MGESRQRWGGCGAARPRHNSAGVQLVLVQGADVLVQVELEPGAVRAEGAGMGLLAGVG